MYLISIILTKLTLSCVIHACPSYAKVNFSAMKMEDNEEMIETDKAGEENS